MEKDNIIFGSTSTIKYYFLHCSTYYAQEQYTFNWSAKGVSNYFETAYSKTYNILLQLSKYLYEILELIFNLKFLDFSQNV